MSMIALDDVVAAAERLRGVANRTPVLRSRTLDQRCSAEVFVKAESFQRTGSFKFRGAYNRISRLSADERARGVLAFSSGNHAQAVALAASLVGTKAVVVMPMDAPSGKLAATKGYGAEVVQYDRYREDREALGRAVAEERGLTLVPPFDDPVVMAGQGTAALELIEEAGPLDVLLTPVGGGGLIAGSATAVKGLLPASRVIGIEPEAGDDTRRSLRAGRLVRLPEVPRTIADGLQLQAPGDVPFEVVRRLVDDVVVVSDEAITRAMVFLFERMKAVAEPSGAVGIAALLSGKVDVRSRRVGVVLSGGNVAADRFAQLIAGASLPPD
jgi:threonine ammonia-lyase medium form